ncbi:Rha family transcriptional regulator [Aliarcobacter butzleri]|uniref:Rha family transcriptional regulator n=1 Tax=Aliarcobacter butzleri TaxID=28197 RepID=UPI0021B6A224|nr:phage regulatory protein/antirepressor Ant [Aliarcobacter butzleri]MCT7643451.1 phage regulatory protein/antirepressor Ant [Aliarcobacter butzleri]
MSVNIQIDLFNQNLVQEKNGELLVSSITIAENVGYEHNAVIRLIRDNIKDFNEFGMLGFENESFKDSLNRIQTREIALLNENHSTLLITYMRNNDLTKRFKINLVKAFSIMKNKLLQKELPTPLETARMLVQVLEEKEALLLTNKALEKQNTILMHTNNTYTATEIAKELGLKSASVLNQKLAEMKIQYKINNSWVFYSKYADLGYTSIKQHILENGKEIYDRKFTQTGRDFILKLFEMEGAR